MSGEWRWKRFVGNKRPAAGIDIKSENLNNLNKKTSYLTNERIFHKLR